MKSFEEMYPNVAAWTLDGWIELGRDEYSQSFIRVLDIGGMVWEGEERYETIHDALSEAELRSRRGWRATGERQRWWSNLCLRRRLTLSRIWRPASWIVL